MAADLSFQLTIWGFALHGDTAEPAARAAELRPTEPGPPELQDATLLELSVRQLHHDDEQGQARRCVPPQWTALPAVVDAVARGLLPYSPCRHDTPAPGTR